MVYCRIWEKMNGSLSQCIIALLDIHYRYYSNSFTVNMTFSIHSFFRTPMTLYVVNFHWVFTVEFGRKMNGSLSQYIIALLDIHTGITQIPSQLTKTLEWILLQDTQDSVLVSTFMTFYCRIWEKMNGKVCHNALYNSLTFIQALLKFLPQLTIKLEWILLRMTMTLSVLTFTGLTVEFGGKEWQSLSQYIIALLDIHTGITQIPSQLTMKWILLQDDQTLLC